MNTHDEVENLKKDILCLQAAAQFQTVAFGVLYSIFLHSLESGEHGKASVEKLEKAYRLTLKHQIESSMAAMADDRPGFATELHQIYQDVMKNLP